MLGVAARPRRRHIILNPSLRNISSLLKTTLTMTFAGYPVNFLDSASPISGFPVLDAICRQRDVHAAMHEALHVIDPVSLGTVSLRDWLSGLSREELEILFSRSVERASHFKWFLGENAYGYAVWLHEYKAVDLPDAVGSFAASVHNHRYSFVSRILSGSLSASNFSYDSARQDLRLFERITFPAETTYFLSSEEIHRIDTTAPSTCTLVIQGPPERKYSRVFDPISGSFQEIFDLSSRFPDLISLLKC
jgi:hypothetical protein